MIEKNCIRYGFGFVSFDTNRLERSQVIKNVIKISTGRN